MLTAALIGAATLSAHAGVHFGFSFGLPVPVVAVAPVMPVVVASPVVMAPSVVVGLPPCPGAGYVWAPGYWSVSAGGPWRLPQPTTRVQ